MSWYDAATELKTPSGTPYHGRIHPIRVPAAEDDWVVETEPGDRLDLLSSKYYGSVRYWRIIAMVNGLPGDQLAVDSGLILRLPRDPGAVETSLAEANDFP